MMPSMRKVRIFYRDPDATDSSDDEDDRNPKKDKKEKKMIGEVQVPVKTHKTSKPLKTLVACQTKDLNGPEKKKSSSRYRGVRLRESGRWQAEIRNPFTKKREYSLHATEEEAAAVYQAKWNQFNAEKLVMKAQPPVSQSAALFSSSSLSCVSTSMSCKHEAQEAQDEVEVLKTDPETTDESALNFSPTPKEISVDALLRWIDGLPVSEPVIPADELPLADSPRPEDMFPVSDFIGATYEPPDNDYIGLADISHLPLPFECQEFNLDAELDWSGFDFDSIEHELKDL